MRPLGLALVVAALAGGCTEICVYDPPRLRRQQEQIDELVRTIDDGQDPCHSDHTPSVDKLIEIGDPAIRRMLDLMLLDSESDYFTRLHAKTVLYGIILNKYGYRSDRSESDPNEVTKRANALWESLGNLSHAAPREERERAVKLWWEWYARGRPI